MGFRDKLRRFFWGRYGIDTLYYALFAFYIILWIVQLFCHSLPPLYFSVYFLQLITLFIMIFRSLSRNIEKRRKENQAFLKFFRPIKNFFVLTKNKIRDRKHFSYVKCPHCKITVRLPKRKGEHPVICPKCRERFFVSGK